jgi:hypothetical protein
MAVSNTYEERLETKDCETKRKCNSRLRAGVRVGNNGFEVLRVMRKRALRPLSTKELINCNGSRSHGLFTSHESEDEGKHPLVLGEYFGRDQNVHRVWGLIIHIEEV